MAFFKDKKRIGTFKYYLQLCATRFERLAIKK